MRSGAVRFTVGAVAWLALAAAGVFIARSERQAADQRAAARAFDLKVREAGDALAEMRTGQQAYVAAGQGVAFWMPKVGATLDAVTGQVNALRQAASTAAARSAIDDAATSLSDFATIDARAREYLKAGQLLMAGDVIFTEGGQTAATAARQLEAARLAEHQGLDEADGARRRLEAVVLAASAGVAAVAVLLLVPLRRRTIDIVPAIAAADAGAEPTAPMPEPAAPVAAAAVSPSPARAAGGSVVALRAAADLCTEFGRVNGVDQLNMLLGRAAEMMDATGLIVWVGDPAGGDLRAMLAYGYAPQVLARMPVVPRGDQNAAAAAYRTGKMQIVMSRPGTAGAVVAPLLSADGCIGALTAEVRAGGEASDSVQALATIFAAQLAGVVNVQPAAADTDAPAKAATAGG